MNSRLRRAAVASISPILALTFIGSVQAGSWDYMQAGYTFNGELKHDETADFDGFDLDLAMSLSERFFLRGQATSWHSDGDSLDSDDTDLVFADWQSFGIGAHQRMPVGDMSLNFWGQLSMDRVAFLASASQGYGAAVGANLDVLPTVTTGLSYRVASTRARSSGQLTRFDPEVLGLEVMYRPTPGSAIRLAYLLGDVDVRGSIADMDSMSADFSAIQLGYRHYFSGGRSERAARVIQPLTYNQIQLGYVVSGDTRLSGDGSSSLHFYLDRGYSLRGSFEIGEHFFFGGETLNVDYRDAGGELADDSERELVTINDMTFIGPGAHYGFANEPVSVYAQLGLSRTNYILYAAEGFGAKAGVRGRLGPAEMGAWYLAAKGKADFFGNTLDVDPSVAGLDLIFEIMPGAPEIAFGYQRASTDISVDSDDGKIHFTALSVGIRQRF